MEPPKLQAIDCILFTVPEDELAEAKADFETVLGFDRIWERGNQIGYKLDRHREGFAEIVLSTDTAIPDGLVHYLVEDVTQAVEYFTSQGYELIDGPLDIGVGSVATIRNKWGHEFEIMDAT